MATGNVSRVKPGEMLCGREKGEAAMKIEAGISTACFYPMETEKALADILHNGVKRVEIFFNAPSELEQGFLRQLNAQLKAANARVVSIHPFTSGFEPFLFFQKYERRFRDSLDFYRRYFFAAASLGAKYIVFHGNLQEKAGDPREYFERFALLRESSLEQGVILVQENVNRYCGAKADFLLQMRRYLNDQVEFTLDLKQSVLAGEGVEAVYKAMGSRLRHIHISDHGPGEACLPIGRGHFDFAAFFHRLQKDGYQGDMVLELYRHSYERPEELYHSVRTLQDILSRL